MTEEEHAPLPIEGSVGLGMDIVALPRMKRILQRSPAFAKRVYTEGEQAYCNATASPYIHYATRFAAKEAVLKALGTGFAFGIDPRDVEVTKNATGRPLVRLHARAKEIANMLGVKEIPLSLSFTHEEAVACAIAITKESISIREQRVDPMEELTRQFKETRSILDDM